MYACAQGTGECTGVGGGAEGGRAGTGVQGCGVAVDDVGDLPFWRRVNTAGLNGSPLYYRPFIDAKPKRIAAALTAMAHAGPGGIIFHCGAGRTGPG